MSKQDYTTTFSVEQTPLAAFNAINNPRGWWSEEIDGSADKIGGVFTYRYGDVHRCKIKVTELIPGKKVVWLVLDNYFDFVEDQTEWKGTSIVFDISKKGSKTEVRFTHVGLVPRFECYNVCRDSWGSIIKGDLRNLITSGEGHLGQKQRSSDSKKQSEELAL
jgi:hypothetical protein